MSDAFDRAIALIDAANAADPNVLDSGGERGPKELVHGRMASAWITRLRPDASEALRLAARGHHVRRWAIPRESYPPGRRDYLRWREELHRFHAKELTALLSEAGIAPETGRRAADLVAKRTRRDDPEAQAFEDMLCLVFLETQFGALAAKLDPAKLPDVIRKTWKKMSPTGHEAALALPLPEADKATILAALRDEPGTSPQPQPSTPVKDWEMEGVQCVS